MKNWKERKLWQSYKVRYCSDYFSTFCILEYVLRMFRM